MWPVLGNLFWAVWISLVGWQWFAEWQTERYLGSHGGNLLKPVVLSRKRLFDGSDGPHYYCTFEVPGALPMEWEVSADIYAGSHRGDRGTVRLGNDAVIDFQKAV